MIIDALREFFNQCPLISGECVDVDFLGSHEESYSIDTVPSEPIIKRYASGGSVRQYCFMLAGRTGYGGGKNCSNAAFYERLGEWIEEKNAKNELPKIGEGKIAQSIEITASGYMFEEDIKSAGYRMQCRLIYTQGI